MTRIDMSHMPPQLPTPGHTATITIERAPALAALLLLGNAIGRGDLGGIREAAIELNAVIGGAA
jgi:hypothetical protein